MTWRYLASGEPEEYRPETGQLWHQLTCGHWVPGKFCGKNLERPRVRRWCPECHGAVPKRPAQERVAIALTRDDAEWLSAILRSGLARDEYKWRRQATRVLLRARMALRKPGRATEPGT